MSLADRKAVRIAASTEAEIRRADAAAARDVDVRRANIELERERTENKRADRLARLEDRRALRKQKDADKGERKAQREARATERRARRAAWVARVRGQLADQLIVVPIVLAMAGAWWGQFGLFRDRLGWPALLAAAAATGIECIGLVCGRLAHLARQPVTVTMPDGRRVERDDSAWVERTLMWGVVGYAGASNWAHSGDPTVGVLSLVGVSVWEARERRMQRQALASAGRLPSRRPRFGAARWLRYPCWTYRAWSAALRHGLTDAADALAVAEQKATERKALGWRARRRFGRVVAERLAVTDQRRRQEAESVIREAEQVVGAAAMLFGPDFARQRAHAATGSRPTSGNGESDGSGGRARRLGWLRLAGRDDRVATEDAESVPVVVDGVDITDLMPVARRVAAELGDRLTRDGLLDGLRQAGLSVGGKRRKAVYDAVLAERERVA
ncbi:hypothetical protein [Saccharothrix sp.]|uniref:hypothetical protein n=1 Tax=Saccharothrix sp. TaxID=1873460 RepID=UPI002810A46A|nr:hypothetical protein [Saccharothrix sp.]